MLPPRVRGWGTDTPSPPSPARGMSNSDWAWEVRNTLGVREWDGGDWWECWAGSSGQLGFITLAKQLTLIPPSVYSRGVLGHLSQGTAPPNPSMPSWGQESFGLELCLDTWVRVSSARLRL